MAIVTLMMMVLGVAVSTVSGLICYLGPTGLYAQLIWVPQASLLFAHPYASLFVGGTLIIAGVAAHPNQVR